MMKLKYVQPGFGNCVYYCWANILDNADILLNMKLGANHVDSRRLVEKYVPGQTLIHVALHSADMFPIQSFEFPKPVEQDQVCFYTVVVASNRMGYFHYIFVLIDQENNMYIFDPHSEKGLKVPPNKLFSLYAVYEIETICSECGNKYFVFNKDAFKHLGIY